MKKIILVFLACISFLCIVLIFIEEKHYKIEDNLVINSSFNYSNNTKRNYHYLNYTENNNYLITNQDDIKNAIYTGLNEGKDIITLNCNYSDYNDCLNDFHTVYDNKNLIKTISNYVSPYNKYSLINYRININDNHAKIVLIIEKKYTNNQIEKINNIIDKYINELYFENKSDEEKVKWAHDFIINNVEYDLDALEKREGTGFSAYDAIVSNKAVCLGYAEAMAIILDKFNIPNIMISNDMHIWNMVFLNKVWLHVDTTWDDSMNSSDIRYDYYLITSDELASLDSSDNHRYDSNIYVETLLN